MPTPILMPALSPTMEEGKLAKWLVEEGQSVAAGDVIAEIETDKATMEVEAVDEGRVGRILVAEGSDNVKVNDPIAMLLLEDENEADLSSALEGLSAPSKVRVDGDVMHKAAESSQGQDDGSSRSNDKSIRVDGKRNFASPLARRLAKANGLELSVIKGTGPHGRIVKRDIDGALSAQKSSTAPKSSSIVTAPVRALSLTDEKIRALYEAGSYDVVPHDGMRKVIAERLTYSKQTIPHFYLSIDCRLDELLKARARLNEAAPKEGPRAFRLSVNDFIIKAMGLSLQQVPGANATWTEGGMLRHTVSDVGVAVAVEGGLFTPVIRHVELKTLSEISSEMRDLADRARRRRLAPHEYQGGTTSISNLGMYGIKSFDAVINPPHATILAVGAGERRPVASEDGGIEVATMLSCTLSCDHRVVDGAIGADLLSAFKGFVEDPVRMLI